MITDRAIDRHVTNAAHLWNTGHNSLDIAKALNVKEPYALYLLSEARNRKLIPTRSPPVPV